jgi:hypothetical protein
MAGDAVMIAPVSRRIPCKQGIFQGNLRNPPPNGKSAGKKDLCRSGFLPFPYEAYQGNYS